MNLFTYGTLQFAEVWGRVVGRTFETVTAEVTGFAAYRVDGRDFPAMAPEPGVVIRGTVYLDIDAAALARLDAFEGDFYERWTVEAACENGEQRKCHAYVLPHPDSPLLTDELWTVESFVAGGGLTRFLNRYEGFQNHYHW